MTNNEMNDIEKLQVLEELFNEPTIDEMKKRLNMIWYSDEFLSGLTERQIKHLYYDEFDDEEL